MILAVIINYMHDQFIINWLSELAMCLYILSTPCLLTRYEDEDKHSCQYSLANC